MGQPLTAKVENLQSLQVWHAQLCSCSNIIYPSSHKISAYTATVWTFNRIIKVAILIIMVVKYSQDQVYAHESFIYATQTGFINWALLNTENGWIYYWLCVLAIKYQYALLSTALQMSLTDILSVGLTSTVIRGKGMSWITRIKFPVCCLVSPTCRWYPFTFLIVIPIPELCVSANTEKRILFNLEK